MRNRLSLTILALLIFYGCSERQTRPLYRNAILILIDTCRYDEVGRITPQGPVTPSIDRFSEEATRFLNASAQAPWTLPSVGTLLTSLYPTVHGAVGHYPYFSRLRAEAITGPELLQNAGIKTCAFVNCAFLDPILDLDRGFDTYDYIPASNLKIRDAKETFGAAWNWLEENRGERFFLLIHLFDPHMDYNPPEPFRSRFLQDQPRPFDPPFSKVFRWREQEPSEDVRSFARALYRAEIASVDAAFGEFLTAFEMTDQLNETVIVVTADHGEEFWDHEQFEHGHSLYEELIHVPLLLRAPGRNWPRESDSRVGLIDIMPTLLELLGILSPKSFQGESLVPILEGSVSTTPRRRFSESLLYGVEWKTVSDDRYKFLYRSNDQQSLLYDLVSDPLETTSLVEEKPEIAQEMIGHLFTWFNKNLALTGGTQQGEEVVDMEEEVVQKLRALGYVE